MIVAATEWELAARSKINFSIMLAKQIRVDLDSDEPLHDRSEVSVSRYRNSHPLGVAGDE